MFGGTTQGLKLQHLKVITHPRGCSRVALDVQPNHHAWRRLAGIDLCVEALAVLTCHMPAAGSHLPKDATAKEVPDKKYAVQELRLPGVCERRVAA
jgi:hypothetical protein